MRKRLWIALLALTLAMGALCIAANAEDEVCDHSGTAAICTEHGSYNEWTCPCGKRAFQARVTVEGATQYYETVADAFATAPDGSNDLFSVRSGGGAGRAVFSGRVRRVEIAALLL